MWDRRPGTGLECSRDAVLVPGACSAPPRIGRWGAAYRRGWLGLTQLSHATLRSVPRTAASKVKLEGFST